LEVFLSKSLSGLKFNFKSIFPIQTSTTIRIDVFLIFAHLNIHFENQNKT